MSDATTVLFGLPGVRVERVERRADGTRVVDVVTDDPTAAACPSCGVVSTSVKGRVVTSPKDIPYGEGRIVVRWHKVRWRCREDHCQRGSFTEAITEVPARARSTLRLRVQMAQAVGDAARSVAEVAQAHGVSWPTAHRAFAAHAATVLTEPAPTAVLGIDETRRGKPRWERCAQTGRWVRVDPWDTGFIDLAGDQGLLG
jgi:transposase